MGTLYKTAYHVTRNKADKPVLWLQFESVFCKSETSG